MMMMKVRGAQVFERESSRVKLSTAAAAAAVNCVLLSHQARLAASSTLAAKQKVGVGTDRLPSLFPLSAEVHNGPLHCYQS